MKKHYSTKDLSAYVDGEHARPEAVRKHLQSCAACAERHLRMEKVSARVRALPEPEIQHGFEARVLRACTSRAEQNRQPRYRFLTPMVATAAALAAGVFGYFAVTGSDFEAKDYTIAAQDTEPETIATDTAELQLAQADERASRAVPDEYFDGVDYNATLLSLDDGEKDTLIQLLGTSLLDDHRM